MLAVLVGLLLDPGGDRRARGGAGRGGGAAGAGARGDAGARTRARALAALAADPEATAFALRCASTFSILLVGLCAGVQGARLAPSQARWAVGPVAALAAGLLSLPLAALARGLGAAHGEGVALALAVPFRALRELLRPVSALTLLVTRGKARFSLPRPPLDEMERALAEYAKGHGASAATSELIHNVFEFREKVARDVMVPRTDIVAVDLETPVPEIIQLLAEEGHSRMPVYRESLDQVVGVLHARDLVPLLASPRADRPARPDPPGPLRPLVEAGGPAPAPDAAAPHPHGLRGGRVRRRDGHLHLEDVLEEIVGEIQASSSGSDGSAVEAHADGTFTVQGGRRSRSFNEATGAELTEDRGRDVAGFLNSIAGRDPGRTATGSSGRAGSSPSPTPTRASVTKVRAARVKRG